MAGKGYTLYKIETVEVVEEGTPEDSGAKYRYHGDASAADAAAPTATATAVAKKKALSAAEKIEANSNNTRARLRDDASEALTRKIEAPGARRKVEGIELGTGNGDALTAPKGLGQKSRGRKPEPEPEPMIADDADEVELDDIDEVTDSGVREPQMVESEDGVEVELADDDDVAVDHDDDEVLLEEPDEDVDLAEDTAAGGLDVDLDEDIPEMPDDVPSLEEPTDEAKGAEGAEGAEDKPKGKLAGKTGRLGLAAGKTGRLGAGAGAGAGLRKTGRLSKGSTGRIKKEGDAEGAEGEEGGDDAPARGVKKSGMTTGRYKMMVYGSYLTVVLCVVLGVWIWIARNQQSADNIDKSRVADEEADAEKHKIERKLQAFTKSYMQARGYKEQAGKAAREDDDEKFQENAKLCLTFAFNALSLYCEAQLDNLKVGGKALDKGNTQYTKQAIEVRKMIFTLHKEPHCPVHAEVPEIKQQLDSYMKHRMELNLYKVQSALQSSDPEAAFNSFDEMHGEAEVMMEEALEASDDGRADDAREAALEAYEYGLQALACYYRYLLVAGSDVNSTNKTLGEHFERDLNEMASKDGMPALTDSPAHATYQKARDDWGQ
ncbi:MAG: hypothetical protein AB7K09_04250 [Planctomycetota bacterium]